MKDLQHLHYIPIYFWGVQLYTMASMSVTCYIRDQPEYFQTKRKRNAYNSLLRSPFWTDLQPLEHQSSFSIVHNFFFFYSIYIYIYIHSDIHIQRQSTKNCSVDLVQLTILTTFDQFMGFREHCVRCSITISITYTTLLVVFSQCFRLVLTLFCECNWSFQGNSAPCFCTCNVINHPSVEVAPSLMGSVLNFRPSMSSNCHALIMVEIEIP